MSNVNDLSKFGWGGRDMAARLLSAWVEHNFADEKEDDCLGDGAKLELNMDSGNVFLTDDEFNVVMFNDEEKLEKFISCPNCGAEGFRTEKICECSKE